MPALALALLLALALAGAGAVAPGPGAAAVRGVFREVLRLQPPPEQPPAAAGAGPPAAPRHMLELYRRYAAGGAPRRGAAGSTVRSIAPAARPAAPGAWPEDVLVFNVSAVAAPGEEVTQAQLHLHRRRQPAPRHPQGRGRALAPPARVRLLQLGPRSGRAGALAALPVPGATRGGWTALDVTAVLRELLLARGRPPPPLLAVRFEAPRGRALAPRAFLRGGGGPDRSPAFLVVFSEDSPGSDGGSEEMGGGPRATAAPPPPHTHAIAELLQTAAAARPPPPPPPQPDLYLEPEPDNRIDGVAEDNGLGDATGPEADTDANDLQLGEDAGEAMERNSLDALPPSPSRGARRRLRPRPRARHPRSLLDNELPGAEPPPPPPPPPRTSPEAVLAPRPRPQAPHPPPPPPPEPEATIPLPVGGGGGGGGRGRLRGPGRRRGPGRGRRRGGGAGGEHRKKPRHREDPDVLRERDRWLPDLDTSDLALGATANANASGGDGNGDAGDGELAPLCQRRKLVVDFADIGWSRFIVAPASFEAFYCAGDCPFPIAKERRGRGRADPAQARQRCALRPTNHATLQSLVRAVGGVPGLPAPCCVPDRLASLSLLYLDASDNIVLKNYPNMAVVSCACR